MRENIVYIPRNDLRFELSRPALVLEINTRFFQGEFMGVNLGILCLRSWRVKGLEKY